jgi:hypothetical protein
MSDPLETRLRTDLRGAAGEGPEFVAPDLDAPLPGTRRRWPLVLAAAVVLVAGGAAYAVLRDGPPGGDEASCPYVVKFDGLTWSTIGSEKSPVTEGTLGEGVVPRCDDGNGVSEERTVQVDRIQGVDPTRAVAVNGEILLPVDGEGLPPGLLDAQRAVRCTLDGKVELLGQWTGVVSRREARFDGDVRPPYRIDFETSDPRVTDGYARVLIQAQGTTESRPLKPQQVEALLGSDADDLLTAHCAGPRFVVDRLRAAP